MQTERRLALGVVVVAAGRSTRMGGQDKVLAPLAGRPLLEYSLVTIARHAAVRAIVVVAAVERLEEVWLIAERAGEGRVTDVVPGGPRRQDSVRAGVAALPPVDAVAVHDGARPFVTHAMIERGLAALATASAALTAVPVVDTIKRVDAVGTVMETLPRAELRAAQTPQFFRAACLAAAYAAIDWTREFTDEAAMVEATGATLVAIDGAPANIKITTPTDLLVAEALLRAGVVADD